MGRGAGVTRIRAAQPNQPLPEGREPGDARGLTWPILLAVVGGSIAVIVAAIILGSVLLYLNDKPIGPWVRELAPYVLGLIGTLFTILLTRLLNNDGRGLRNQQTLAANQEAVYRLTHKTADGLLALASRVDALTERLDERDDAETRQQLQEAVQAVRTLSEETGARLGRLASVITGQQRAVPTREEPESPRRPSTALSTDSVLSDPRLRGSDPTRQDPLDTRQPWHTGDTGVQPAVPEEDRHPWRPYGR